nr:COP9 signalosome complex subunit 6 [Polyrhizophydium stewartii]
MDVDVGVVAAQPSSSGLSITLHPLVILNISDQFTRTKMQHPASSVPPGREIEIINSFEVPLKAGADGSVSADMDYFVFKQEQYRQVFPSLDFLGWYSTGTSPSPADMSIHQQMSQHNEAPLFLQMRTEDLNPESSDLPLIVYETTVDIVGGAAHTLFAKAQFKVETSDAERLAVEHVAHATNAGGDTKLVTHLIGQQNAIRMLHSRVAALVKYLEEVQQGSLPKDHTLMRQISSLCNRLPTMQGDDFESEFNEDYNDVLLMTFLATVTKGAHQLNELVDKLNIIGGKRAQRNVLRMGSMTGMGMGMGVGMGSIGSYSTNMGFQMQM